MLILADENQSPDFYLTFPKCKSVVGYQVPSEDALKVLDGFPVSSACTRRSRELSCRLFFQDGDTSLKLRDGVVKYNIIFDSPPNLHFTDEYYSDFYAIDTTTHTAVLITRMLGDKFIASKVCHGTFFTESEREAMEQLRKGKQ